MSRLRRKAAYLWIVPIVTLAAVAYGLLSPARSGADGSKNGGADAVGGTDRSIGATTVTASSARPPQNLPPNPALAGLHAEATRQFVNGPSNGIGRIGMTFYNPAGVDHARQSFQFGPSTRNFQSVWMNHPSLPDVRIEDDSTIPIDLANEHREKEAKDLDSLHRQTVGQFVGGPPTPLPQGTWWVRNIDLVGLVKHDRPVVYVSEKVLEMTDLKDVPKRKLDRFEVAGLEKLQGGEDLFARKQKDTIRLLGSVRAQKECLSCHDGGEGKLLGAFSYTLRNSR
jgi:hypothetical protein